MCGTSSAKKKKIGILDGNLGNTYFLFQMGYLAKKKNWTPFPLNGYDEFSPRSFHELTPLEMEYFKGTDYEGHRFVAWICASCQAHLMCRFFVGGRGFLVSGSIV